MIFFLTHFNKTEHQSFVQPIDLYIYSADAITWQCYYSVFILMMNSGLTSHQQRGHTETGPRFKVSSERPEKRGIDLATPGLVVQRVIHYTTAASVCLF